MFKLMKMIAKKMRRQPRGMPKAMIAEIIIRTLKI